jgi:hypothetical protein
MNTVKKRAEIPKKKPAAPQPNPSMAHETTADRRRRSDAAAVSERLSSRKTKVKREDNRVGLGQKRGREKPIRLCRRATK